MSTTPKQPKQELKDSVLSRIEAEQIQPRSKMWWQCLECMVWVFWSASILFGAVAVAELLFASTHARYALYEATHDSFLTFAIEALPYVWIVFFGIMTWLAIKNMRHTKRGYRYSLLQIVGSSLVFSIIGGLFLHGLGVGQALDNYLGKMMPLYLSQEQKEIRMWQQPTEGRLVGRMAADQTATGTRITFTDANGALWQLETADLHTPDRDALKQGKQVRVLGLYANTTTKTMHACGVFPWMFDKNVDIAMMESERQGFVERMYAHKDQAKEREQALAAAAFGDQAMGLCATMPAVRRIGESMEAK